MDLPGARFDHLVTDEDTPRSFDPLGDLSGELLTSTLTVIQPAHGTATADTSTGRITYSPDRHFNGRDALTYQACDASGACVDGQVTVAVRMFGPHRILVTSPPDIGGGGPIELMLPDGTGPREGTATVGRIAKISPDGRWLAFVAGERAVTIYNRDDPSESLTQGLPDYPEDMAWKPDSSELIVSVGENYWSRFFFLVRPDVLEPEPKPVRYELPGPGGTTVSVPVHGNNPTWGPTGVTISGWYEYTSETAGIQRTGLATFEPGEPPVVRNDRPDLLHPAAARDGTLAMWCETGICTMSPNESTPATLVPLPSYLRVLNIEWSPDSSKIAFDLVDSETRASVVNADGTGMCELNFNGRAIHPSWDSRTYVPARPWEVPGKLAFIFDRVTSGVQKRSLELIRPDGSGRRTISLGDRGLPINLAWSPDGQQLAVSTGYGSGRPADLWVMDADGTDGRSVATGVSGTFDWSPDGAEIAFVREAGPGERGVYVVRSDGTGLRRLVDLYLPMWPVYSPDGQYVLYKWQSGIGPQLYVVPAEGEAAPKAVAGPAMSVLAPDVSPRSDLLYSYGSGTSVALFDWAPDPTLTLVRKIVFTDCVDARWSPDGRAICYHADGGTWVANADGSRTTPIADDNVGGHYSVAWGS